MLQYDFENSLGYWVIATAHALGRALNEELAAQGITLRQWEVLAVLSLHGEQSQTELADRMKIEAPTLVGVLDRMERDGWIQRVSDSSDRRRKLIHPTERVEPVWNKMVECALRVRTRATKGLSGPELEVVRGLLERVRDNLSLPKEAVLPICEPAPAATVKEC
ncbi:MAG: MarR family transcriptional regulator [Planctomycetia bacterium]|nr:MarR family transcriptional regulator [Planctomycetia bacterium]